MNLLCRLGVHSYGQDGVSPEPLAEPLENRVCRRCGKQHGSGSALSRWWGGGRNGITAGELRAALEGVPDDVEVEVESNALFGWAGAESAYLTTKQTLIATGDPQSVPVFRIAGGEHGQGGGVPPGLGG